MILTKCENNMAPMINHKNRIIDKLICQIRNIYVTPSALSKPYKEMNKLS